MSSRPLLRVMLVLAAGAACRPPSRTVDPVVVQLGDQVARRSDFERHVAELEARGGAPLAPAVRQEMFRPFVEQRLLAMEARARGLFEEGRGADAEREAVQQLLMTEVMSRVTVSGQEVEAYCAAHPEEFAVPERLVIRQILVASASEAREVKRRLDRDPRAFDHLARTRSRAPEAGQGGLMGTFARGELPPELEEAAFALPAGQTSAVVASPLGHHVLRVDERQAARPATAEECQRAVGERIRRRRSEQGVRDFVRGLYSRARVNHDAVRLPVS